MAGDWPRDPRAYGSPQHSEPPAAVRTLPSVAELLSSRPPANTTAATYHRPDFFHARSTPPAVSLAPTATASITASTTLSHWIPVNHLQTSPPVSPTQQRPLSTSAAPRVYQEPTLRRQHLSKPDPQLQHSHVSSGVHHASNSTVQARQDSAIDHHRFDTGNDAQLSKPNLSYSHQSPKDDQTHSSPRLSSHQPSPPITSAYPTGSAPHQGESLATHAGANPTARQHSDSLSSTAPSSAPSPRSHEQNIERTIPVDRLRNGVDSRPNITGPSSLPEQFFTQQNNFGTRQQRYNVRFAANYTSENMPATQKSRNETPTPPIAPANVVESERLQDRPSLPPSAADESPAPMTNGPTRHIDPPPRTTRDLKDRGRDHEPSVERCLGCNEAWRRPIPEMGSDNLAPAENNADYVRLSSKLIDKLRDEGKKADAAYEEWKWRHSYCCPRPASPYSTGSADDTPRRPDAVLQTERPSNGNIVNKRKSDVPHDPPSASKHRRVASTSPAPAVQQLDAS